VLMPSGPPRPVTEIFQLCMQPASLSSGAVFCESRHQNGMRDPLVRDNNFSELMRAAQAGNSRKYLLLLEEITPRIRRVVRSQRAFLQVEDIEDLVQDILVSVHAVRASYDPERPFVPWLLAIVRNRLADGARRHARSTAREIQVENLAVTFTEEPAN